MTAPTLDQIATKGAGTTFWRLTDGQKPITKADFLTDAKWQQIAHIRELTPGEITVEDTEDNYLDDGDASWTKTTPGTKSAGDTSLTIAWLPGETTQQQLIADVNADTITYYRAKYPNGTVDVWFGYINSLGKTVAIKEKMTRTIKIKNVGKPTTAEEVAQMPEPAKSNA